MPRVKKNERIGSSIVELIVVIGIIGLLISLLLPAAFSVHQSSLKLACKSNLRQVGIALQDYCALHGHFPDGPPPDINTEPLVLVTWMAMILPYLESDSLWKETQTAINISPLNPNKNPPHIGASKVISTYVCPSNPRLLTPLYTKDLSNVAFSSYLGVSGTPESPGFFGNYPGIRSSAILDGASQTLALGERPPPQTLQAGQWYSRIAPERGYWGYLYGPDEQTTIINYTNLQDVCIGPFMFGPGRLENSCDRYHFWSLHPQGANFMFADGSVKFINYSARDLLGALATRSGGETAELP